LVVAFRLFLRPFSLSSGEVAECRFRERNMIDLTQLSGLDQSNRLELFKVL
jgi:hypothetical protein